MSRDSPEWRVQRYNIYFNSPNVSYLTIYQLIKSVAQFLLVLALLLANSIPERFRKPYTESLLLVMARKRRMKSNLFGQYVVGFASNQEGDAPLPDCII